MNYSYMHILLVAAVMSTTALIFIGRHLRSIVREMRESNRLYRIQHGLTTTGPKR
jgi:hypothetical protein